LKWLMNESHHPGFRDIRSAAPVLLPAAERGGAIFLSGEGFR